MNKNSCMHARPFVGSSPKVNQACALWWGTLSRNFRIVAKKLNEKTCHNWNLLIWTKIHCALKNFVFLALKNSLRLEKIKFNNLWLKCRLLVTLSFKVGLKILNFFWPSKNPRKRPFCIFGPQKFIAPRKKSYF